MRSSSTKRAAPLVTPSVASTHEVPIVGWPAKGTSRAGVKMRMAATQSVRVEGNTNTVSAWFVSRAIACISRSSRPRASSRTARPLPARI